MILYQRLVAGSESIYVVYRDSGEPMAVYRMPGDLYADLANSMLRAMPTLDVAPHQIKETTEWAFRRGVLR